jgi:hypothetical protein
VQAMRPQLRPWLLGFPGIVWGRRLGTENIGRARVLAGLPQRSGAGSGSNYDGIIFYLWSGELLEMYVVQHRPP